MAADRDWLRLDQQAVDRDSDYPGSQPCSGCLELGAEVERLRAALERANRERRGCSLKVFRLACELDRRAAPGRTTPRERRDPKANEASTKAAGRCFPLVLRFRAGCICQQGWEEVEKRGHRKLEPKFYARS